MDDDREVAEQIDQQFHRSGRRHGEWHVAAGDMAVHRQHLPADDILARRQFQMGVDDVGRSVGAIGMVSFVRSGRISVRRERPRSIRLL